MTWIGQKNKSKLYWGSLRKPSYNFDNYNKKNTGVFFPESLFWLTFFWWQQEKQICASLFIKGRHSSGKILEYLMELTGGKERNKGSSGISAFSRVDPLLGVPSHMSKFQDINRNLVDQDWVTHA